MINECALRVHIVKLAARAGAALKPCTVGPSREEARDRQGAEALAREAPDGGDNEGATPGLADIQGPSVHEP